MSIKFYPIPSGQHLNWHSKFIYRTLSVVTELGAISKSAVKFLLVLTFIFNLANQRVQAQSKTVTGTVVDELNAPLPGATITEKGKKNGSMSNNKGKYSISVTPGAILLITYNGYESREVVVGNQVSLDVQLKAKENGLNEVVVTALGIKREKRELTYSTQQVSGEILSSTKEPGVLNALTGRVSGVQITSSTGQPGSSSRIVIRGSSSLTGDNEALIVVDGIPINNSQTGNAGSGGGVSRLSDIDPLTIESINVLKGSAASALYGSNAGRGVVIITTKNGALNSKPKVTLNSQYSFENPIYPQIQTKYALGDRGVYFDGEAANQKTSTVWGPLISDLEAQGIVTYNKNPMDAFFQTGETFTNTANVNGGTEKANYFMSFSNLDQTGTVPTTTYKRNSLFVKYGNKITDKINSIFQLTYVNSSNHRINEGYDLTSPLWTVYTSPATWNPLPAVDVNGNQRVFRASRNNPYWNLDNVYNNEKINRFIPVMTFTYNPVSWITVTERAGADIYAEQVDYFEAPSVPLGTTGLITERASNFRQFNSDLIIEGRKTFNNFGVSLLLGNNIISTFSQSHSISGTGLTITGFDNVKNGSTITAGQSYSEVRKIGFYAQSNISYKTFLNLSLTGRYDGTSKLSLDNNFYPYGSASVAFQFSELLKIPALSFGKLRVSYSAVGNDNVGAYAGSTSFVTAGSFPYGGNAGFLLNTTLGNSTLKNERTNEAEIGLEMNFLKNRIGFEVSYFDRRHKDLLTSVPIAASTGFSSTVINAGDMYNKGIEALLNVTPVKGSKFSWDATFNFTKIKNKVTKVNSSTTSLSLGQTWAFVGDPYGVFYNYGYARTDDGQLLIDNNGLPIVSSVNQKIGNLQPDYLAGMNNTFRYGPVSLSFFFDVRKGGDIFNSDDRYGWFYGTPKVTENREDRVIAGIVQSTGQPNTKVIAAEDYYQRLNLIYEAAIQDGTYVKLRNASIGYTVPSKLLAKSPFSNASFTVTGRNLWIHAPHFTGSDPEVSSYGTGNGSQGVVGNPVPTSRSFNFTLNVTFK
jgi:TonB-linked SusC/RagA family outer membrane protein